MSQISGKIFTNANFSVLNWTEILMLMYWQCLVWHSCLLIWMAFNLTVQDYIHSFVYMISCLNCTAQLTGTNIVNSVRRHFKVTWSHHLAWTEGHRKNTLFCVGELWKLPSLLSFACIKNVKKQSPLKIEK